MIGRRTGFAGRPLRAREEAVGVTDGDGADREGLQQWVAP